jgi:hypothetical protein
MFENHGSSVRRAWLVLTIQMLLCSCFLSNAFCQSFYASVVVQSMALLESLLHPLWSPLLLLACLLPHSLTHSVLLISPSFHEWVVGEILPLCVMSTMAPTLITMAPQECSIMWHSLVCTRPHHSFLTWVVLSSCFFFFPRRRRWEGNQSEWIGLSPNSKL